MIQELIMITRSITRKKPDLLSILTLTGCFLLLLLKSCHPIFFSQLRMYALIAASVMEGWYN